MIINNLEEMKIFANKLASGLKEGDVLNLIGEMSAGKTTLTSFISQYFSVDDSSSPTFAIVNIYEGDIKIYHLDLYRFDDPDEILDIDYETYFYPDDGLTILEWGENVAYYLPEDMINLEIRKIDENKREITISDDSRRGRELNEYLDDFNIK
ncbi:MULTISPECIES: tRNA (adenosine(37)-N6)-threonylcarbamoyltransferase complex ATPase subunit type 1 TsaE [Anaerococcus]|uniref:tRNA (adenosine(37)-N6)-threonylcarbamoyltransferase complex ATPase subunit type 1 TsaE n=1 Tax=Anaerococcus TaxID=165779 RepID=UPI001AE73D99|nr:MULTISPECIES: tRNA (adenosine(37)-N6)-threonylcarbamoyltransferase complex ATPase subunit type 1 TsaE [Anaerococcus]MBP2069045.1 tRNA threonylcarbamoyladenosine biosynthesis protein TsaE [Anaerococcus nagyae]MDU3211007.1 tRNA (adenosine(37)-N6)-threonylcarbamoyltransferase complex ATPase subunit type 1 TsaE [Anaerococcus sp.]